MTKKIVKIIGVEEHVVFPDLFARLEQESHAWNVFTARTQATTVGLAKIRSTTVGEQRLKDMDDSGVAMQVLSTVGAVNSTHCPKHDPKEGVRLARDINDAMKAAVDTNPTRYKAFAELPFHEPEEAIKELHRCVKELGFLGAMLSGSVCGNGRYLDSPEFDAVLSAFEELDVPLYLHPGVPPKAVWDTYYKIQDKPVLSAAFGLAGWGWHSEVAIHLLRLALSGTLDRHRKLKIIVGHQGEMMPPMMHRFDTIYNPPAAFGLERPVTEMLRSQVWVAISGFFSIPPTMTLIATWGVDRVLFANDYPFVAADKVQDYIRRLGDMVSPLDLEKICHRNAESLLRLES